MRAAKFVLTLFVFGFLATTTSAQISAFLDDDFFFVLNGTGEQLSGVDIVSPLGALIPPDRTDAAPFTFLLSNTPNQVTYGNLGTGTTVDGNLKLTAKYDPLIDDPNTEVFVGIGPDPVKVPFAVGPCENCPTPVLRASVNSDLNFVLQGRGQTLSEITFRSPSGSLSAATNSAPFAETTTNTANQITLASPGSQVALEGEVVLSAGWSSHLYTRDVEYDYALVEDGATETIGPFTLKNAEYEYRFPSLPLLNAFVRNDDHIVLNGRGQPITSFSLSSETDSLIPSADTGPFDGYGESNSSSRVDFVLNDSMTLEGEVVLPVRWDWHKPKSIRLEYEQLGELPSRLRTLSASAYPFVPESGKEPLLITLDANNNFVITGIGQEVGGIEFISPSGSLRPTAQETVAPFPITLSNDPDHITLGVLGAVTVDGSFVTDFGPVDPSNMDDLLINVGFGPVPVPNLFNIECDRCEYPSVVVNEDRGLVLENFPDPVTELKFTSEFGGLQIVDSLPAGLDLVSSTANELVVGSETGFEGKDLSGLTAVWGASADSQVFVSFAFLDGSSFGPLPLDIGAPTVPEPSSGLLLGLAVLGLLQARRRRP